MSPAVHLVLSSGRRKRGGNDRSSAIPQLNSPPRTAFHQSYIYLARVFVDTTDMAYPARSPRHHRRESFVTSSTVEMPEYLDFDADVLSFDNFGHHTPISRRGSNEEMDLNFANLTDLLPGTTPTGATDLDSMDALSVISSDGLPTPRADSKMNTSMRITAPIGNQSGARHSFVKLGGHGAHSPFVKEETRGSRTLSPAFDTFLRDTWEDVASGASRSRNISMSSIGSINGTSPSANMLGAVHPTGPAMANHNAHSSFHLGYPQYSNHLATTMSNIPMSMHTPSTATFVLPSTSNASISASTIIPNPLYVPPSSLGRENGSKSLRAPRKAKQCVVDGCVRRAQSNNRCKTHGGGARCQREGCHKSSQGGGLCRAHGGGKKCSVPGCDKGTQRLGLCYLHGGIRRCIFDGCTKKDRGNGYCISHGGGRRCEMSGCTRSVRKGNHCQMHQTAAKATRSTTGKMRKV